GQGHAQRDEGRAPQLVAEAGADELVPDLRGLAPQPGDGLADPGFLVVGQLRGPDGEVVGPGRLHDGPGETGTGDGRPGLFWVHWGAGRVLHQPPAGELHT